MTQSHSIDRRQLDDLVTGRRVLLVHGDEEMRCALEVLLTERYEVDAVSSAELALLYFAPGRYDVLVTELDLPGLSGDELLRTLRLVDPPLAGVAITSGDLDSPHPRLQDFEHSWSPAADGLVALLAGVGRALRHAREQALAFA